MTNHLAALVQYRHVPTGDIFSQAIETTVAVWCRPVEASQASKIFTDPEMKDAAIVFDHELADCKACLIARKAALKAAKEKR